MCNVEFYVVSDEHGFESGSENDFDSSSWRSAKDFRDNRGYGDLVVKIGDRYFKVEKEYRC